MRLTVFIRRLDICRACAEFVPAAGHGACKLIRDPSEGTDPVVITNGFERVSTA